MVLGGGLVNIGSGGSADAVEAPGGVDVGFIFFCLFFSFYQIVSLRSSCMKASVTSSARVYLDAYRLRRGTLNALSHPGLSSLDSRSAPCKPFP